MVEDSASNITNKNDELHRSEASMDAATLYLKEIGYAPLLTAEEEVFYTRKTR